MSDAKKCETCGGYYDRARFVIRVKGPGGQSGEVDCCSVACAGIYAERETARLSGPQALMPVKPWEVSDG